RRAARDRVQRRFPSAGDRVGPRRRDPAEADQPALTRPHPGRRRRLLVPDHADPPRGLIVDTVTLRDFRSYARLEVALEPGIVLVIGRKGVGKTNLLEALHVGTQGFSPRTRTDAQLVRFGQQATRVALTGTRAAAAMGLEIVITPGEGKRARLNGATLR